MMTFFTADTHFDHANIIKYAKRPQLRVGDLDEKGDWISKSVKHARANEMTEHSIANWNTAVSHYDTVNHVGDFAFGSTAVCIRLLRRLNGNINFIWGNHDDNLKQVAGIINLYPDLKDRIKFLGNYAEIRVEGQDIVLMHYAMRVWNGSHRGAWQLYGHSHGSLSDDPNALSIDVGVDCHKQRPICFNEIKTIMSKKNWKPVDHHGKREEGGGIGLGRDEYAKLERKRMYEQLKTEFGT